MKILENTKGRPLMEWLRCCLMGGLITVVLVPGVGSQGSVVKSDEEILIELERAWNEAFYSKDVAFLESILADDFVATYDDGSRGDKARELMLAREFNQQVVSAVQDEFAVSLYGEVAIVRFRLRLSGMRQGELAELSLRYTDVWVLQNGSWQCVSTHSSKVNAA